MGKARKLKLIRNQREIKQINYSKKIFEWKYIGVIVIVGFIVFIKVFFNEFVWDDLHQIVENKQTLLFQNIPQLFIKGFDFTYRPIFFATISILNTIFELKPFFFHSVSILLHLANTTLVFFLFQKFFSKRTAFILSLFFLVHPMNVEPVANISFMMELLYFLFGIIALLLLTSINTRLSFKRLLLSMLFLLLSLLSKESGILLIPIIFSYFNLFQRKLLARTTIALLTTFGLYLFIRLGIAERPLIHKYLVPPYIPIQKLSFFDRLMSIPAIINYYFTTFFFPINLAVQQYWIVKTIDFLHFFLPLISVVAIIGTIIYCARMTSKRDKLLYQYFLFFSFWFLFGIIFHLQILPLTMTVADRWFYLPMVGLLGMIACITSLAPRSVRRFFPTIAIILLVLLSIRSLVRTYDWKDNYTLYSHDSQILKDNFSLENNLGAELLGKDNELAKYHIEKSIKLAPDWWLNWANLGTYYFFNHDLKQAKKYYEVSLKNGNNANTYQLYSKVLLYDDTPGSTASARRILEQGIGFYPEDWSLWELLALANYQLDDKEKAIIAAKRAYQLTGDKRYQSLSEAITKGIKFHIKGDIR